MTFTAGIPKASDTLSTSQPQILGNFSAINSGFGKDHVNFTQSSNIGQHNQITFLGKYNGANPPTDVPSPTDGVLINSEWIAGAGKDKFVLWYREKDSTYSPAAYQLTATYNPKDATAGYTYLPGGLCMMWGIETPLTSYATNVAFPTTNTVPAVYFDGPPYSIMVTPITKDSGSSSLNPDDYIILIKNGSVSASGFTTSQSSWHNPPGHLIGFYWMAIGPCK
jgi:hypothetical protein